MKLNSLIFSTASALSAVIAIDWTQHRGILADENPAGGEGGAEGRLAIKGRQLYDGTNVALDKSFTAYTASSIWDSNYIPSHAFDGNVNGTRWASTGAVSNPENQYLQVDLGEFHQIGAVVIYWEVASPKIYEIQVSNDGNQWNMVWSKSDGSVGMGKVESVFNNVNTQYVRMLVINGGVTIHKHVSIWEMEIYGTPLPTSSQPSSSASTTTAPSTSPRTPSSAPTTTAPSTSPPTPPSTPECKIEKMKGDYKLKWDVYNYDEGYYKEDLIKANLRVRRPESEGKGKGKGVMKFSMCVLEGENNQDSYLDSMVAVQTGFSRGGVISIRIGTSFAGQYNCNTEELMLGTTGTSTTGSFSEDFYAFSLKNPAVKLGQGGVGFPGTCSD